MLAIWGLSAGGTIAATITNSTLMTLSVGALGGSAGVLIGLGMTAANKALSNKYFKKEQDIDKILKENEYSSDF